MGVVRDAQIKKTKSGKDYLSLDVETGELYRTWVTTFSKINELVDILKPESQVYIEGSIKIRLVDTTPFFHVSASVLQPLFEISARPKERAKKSDADIIRGPASQNELERRAAEARKTTPDYDAPNDEISF